VAPTSASLLLAAEFLASILTAPPSCTPARKYRATMGMHLHRRSLRVISFPLRDQGWDLHFLEIEGGRLGEGAEGGRWGEGAAEVALDLLAAAGSFSSVFGVMRLLPIAPRALGFTSLRYFTAGACSTLEQRCRRLQYTSAALPAPRAASADASRVKFTY
jgi:hypothetical protein